MTYQEVINVINNDKTGIAKGYSISFLSENFVCLKTEDELTSLFKKDLTIFNQLEKSLLSIQSPIEGDFVNYEDNKYARISRIHSNGRIQLSNKIGVFIFNDSSQASCCTWDCDLNIKNDKICLDNLTLSNQIKKGECWTFSEKLSGGDRGVYFQINFKVWNLD